MSATKTKKRKSKGSKGIGGPYDMTKAVRGGRVTYYKPGVIDLAREKGTLITVMQAGKPMLIDPERSVHRANLLSKFGPSHEDADRGKYINNGAFSISGKEVRGAHLVNPYLRSDGSYHTIVAAFLKSMNQSRLRGMTAKIRTSIEDGTHLLWAGRQTADQAVIVSPWLSADELWDRARKVSSDLVAQLRRVKSQRSKVKEHLDPRGKFDQNLGVMRRARTAYNPATGETVYKGGITPCSMPLEQCGFAIDMCHLTDAFNAEGLEQGGYYYRMAIGRMTPWVLYRRHWIGLDPSSSFAYYSDQVLQKSRRKSHAA